MHAIDFFEGACENESTRDANSFALNCMISCTFDILCISVCIYIVPMEGLEWLAILL